ncbi:unnamed protein product [Porites evermanni]|uniref:Major facilitator superfamily (MFS) profile domain-containing protein n=1 Tax=Porites evermanni TaxID=104178 RepID=A0ABN8M9R0_9CNID|nr:unnamed protein product [Porites evermanni]
MAGNSEEMELKDSAAPGSPQQNYDSLKELNANNETTEKTYTLSDAVEEIGIGKFQILLILMAGFVNMCDSLELLLLSILAPTIHCLWHLSSWEEAFITTVVFLGMAVGGPLWGYLSDNFGRKSMIIVSAIWIGYFGFISSFSPHYIWIITLRCLVGVGIGGIPSMYTLLIEFLPINVRSYIILCLAFFWALGSTFLVFLALIVMPTLGWRWLTALSTIPVVIFIILCKWLPESPRFLVAIGEKEKAMEVLQRMAKINKAKLPEGTLKIETQINADQGSFLVLFNREYRLTTLLLLLTFFTSGFVYYGVVLMTTQLMQQTPENGTSCDSESLSLSTSICGCKLLTYADYIGLLWTSFAEFPGILFTMLFMERLGRKKTIAGELLLTAASLSLLFFCTDRNLTLVFIFMVRGLSLGLFQGFYVYAPEVYPTIVRSVGFGTCACMSRVGAMITPYIAQVLVRVSINLSSGVYIAFCVMAFFATLLLPYETKGRPMQVS